MAKISKKGFTLVELIVVIAIIGVLAAILVPSMLGYVKRSKRTSDISSAKSIHDSVMAILADNEEAAESFGASGTSKHHASGKTGENTDNYDFVIVCSKDGASNNGKNHSSWTSGSKDAKAFLDALNHFMGKGKTPVKFQKSSSGKKLNRWFIGYRDPDPIDVEIWVGDGTTNTPMYRVWPDANSDYE
ncbi:type II secretion system protein [uncultured Ruminococcus sp.]|uniref:type II secretion system protein n=1 Tax=uncultured Ruminococcus sp. TaxID=165186 RepID=UPI00262AEFFD|nr:prepilin-type N-terminal cleavage/methylation domain-containing protein [uncultured Ruminococcus sp.]